jgi:DNA-binding NarL/FixJ family response regulator
MHDAFMKPNMSDGGRPFVWLVDRRPLCRCAFRTMLSEWAAGHDLAVEVAGADAVEPSDLDGCRLALVSLGGADLAAGEGLDLVGAVQARLPTVPLAVIADAEDARSIRAALGSGGRGYISTMLEPDVVGSVLSLLLAGGSYVPPTAFLSSDAAEAAEAPATATTGVNGNHMPLTERQQAVLRCLHQGKSNKMIARELDMRESTVKVHVRSILRKLGALNRTQAALAAVELENRGRRREAEIPAPVLEDGLSAPSA